MLRIAKIKILLTCTIFAINIGNMEIGNLNILNSESDTKAFSASSTLSSDDMTYTANVVNDTWNKNK